MPMFPTGAIKGPRPTGALTGMNNTVGALRPGTALGPSNPRTTQQNLQQFAQATAGLPSGIANSVNVPRPYTPGQQITNAAGGFGGGWSQNDDGQWGFNPGQGTVMQGGAGHGGSFAGGATFNNPNYLGNGQYRQASNPIGSANYGAIGGLQNYLNMLPANQQQNAAAQLRQQGFMPSYNGYGIDRLPMNQNLLGVSAGATTGNYNMPQGNAGAGYFAANGDYIQGNGTNIGTGVPAGLPPGVHPSPSGRPGEYVYNPSGRPGTTAWVPWHGDVGGGGNLSSSGGIAGGGTGAAGMGAGGGLAMNGGGGGLGAQAQGYPLQPQMQGAIQGILSNPSPFSQQQQSMMRNNATLGVEQQARTAQQNAAEDAVRRGLNPAEAQANQFAIAGQANAQRQGALNQFELANAQATRSGLLGGLQAGMGFTGQQMQEENSIRSYLAQLAAAQGGNPPMYLNF